MRQMPLLITILVIDNPPNLHHLAVLTYKYMVKGR